LKLDCLCGGRERGCRILELFGRLKLVPIQGLLCRGAYKAKIGRSRLRRVSAIPAAKPQRFQIWEELHDYQPQV
jgi:hypothetical protein